MGISRGQPRPETWASTVPSSAACELTGALVRPFSNEREIIVRRQSTAAVRAATKRAANAVLAHRRAREPVTGGRDDDPALGVGACACDVRPSCGPVQSAAYAGACYERMAEMQGCPLSALGGGQINVAAGGAINFQMQIDNSDYFAPVFARLSGRSNADPTVRIPWKMTSVRIGNVPQECYDVTNPTAATETRGVWSESYDTFSVDGKTTTVQPGIRVRWGIFSLNTLSKSLDITGFSHPNAQAAIDVSLELFGYCIDQIPCNWKRGHYPGDSACPDKWDEHLRKMKKKGASASAAA